jgi:hypothetical protein
MVIGGKDAERVMTALRELASGLGPIEMVTSRG